MNILRNIKKLISSKKENMVRSILDTDLYKFTTSWAYMSLYPNAEGTFTFTDRNNTAYSMNEFNSIKDSIKSLCELSLDEESFQWCVKNIPFIPQCYWEWLKSFRFEPKKVKVDLDRDGHLSIEVTDKLYRVTLYEVPILAIVSECANGQGKSKINEEIVLAPLREKVEISNSLKLPFSEFGTRRRCSARVQDIVIGYLKDNATYCNGTSNVQSAMDYNMKPMGTHPHEWFMFHGAVFGYRQANFLSLEDWVKVYDGDLGIALADTYTSDVFLKGLTKKQGKLFDGVRHDSGDPYDFIEKVIKRYNELNIDPTTKTIIFSNALTFPEYAKIFEYCRGRIRCSAGIGTNLTHDVSGYRPSNIVMKLTKCRLNPQQEWRNCVKISDDLGKQMGDDKVFNDCLTEVGIEV